MEEKKSIGLGFGLLLGTISIFIMMLIGFSFFVGKPEYSITPAIIVLICLLLVIALSSSFDNFSIGKLLTISKEAKENKDRIEKLEKEKEELIFKLVNVNFQSQKATSNVILGDSFVKRFAFLKANSDEISAEDRDEERANDKDDVVLDSSLKNKTVNRKKYRSTLLKKYCEINKINTFDENIKLEWQYQNQIIDPISTRPMLCHAHYEDNNREIFLRVLGASFSVNMMSYRIYGLLNRINLYRNVKKTNAFLVILLNKPQDQSEKVIDDLNRLRKFFAPAIASRLLEIQEIELSKEDVEICYEDA